MAARFSGPGLWGHGFARFSDKRLPQWTGDVALVVSKLREPLTWREHRKVFVNSTSDLFHEGLSDRDIDHVFAVMAICLMHERRPSHTFQVLTKRSARLMRYMTAPLSELRERIADVGAPMMADGDAGISSCTIYGALHSEGGYKRLGGRPWTGVPLDPDDFGRCYRLIQLFPQWRTRLPEVAAKHPEWARIVEHWDELAMLYEQEKPSDHCPQLYALMQVLR
jgi:hypothetical protein